MRNTSLGKLISLLFRFGRLYISKELEQFNIGKGQFWLLHTLYQKDGYSQEELAQLLTIDKGTTARGIVKLEKAGFITRKPNERDQRANQIFLTQKARDFEPHVRSVLKKWNEILSEGMSEEEVEKTLVILSKMCENAAKYIDETRK